MARFMDGLHPEPGEENKGHDQKALRESLHWFKTRLDAKGWEAFALPYHLERKPLQVFRFRNHRDYRMVRSLRIERDPAQDAPRVKRG